MKDLSFREYDHHPKSSFKAIVAHLLLAISAAALGIFLYGRGIGFSVNFEILLAAAFILSLLAYPSEARPAHVIGYTPERKKVFDFLLFALGFLLIMTVSNRLAHHLLQSEETAWHATFTFIFPLTNF